MSEYQHYAFRAIDRSLTAAEMAELRALSTRATITPRSFTNEYHWGDFKGNPDVMMERYFDAHTYVTNWRIRRFILRFPAAGVDPEAWAPYLVEGRIEIRQAGRFVVMTFEIDDERRDWPVDEGDGEDGDEPVYGDGGYDEPGEDGMDVIDEADDWLPDLIPLRDALMEGDLSTPYLAWLLAVEAGFVAEEAAEPPVPPEVQRPSRALERWISFLGLDPALLTAARRGAPPPAPLPDATAVARWVAALPATEKDALLVRLVAEPEARIGPELRRRFAQARRTQAGSPVATGRSVAQLLAAADDVRAERARAAAEAARQEAIRAAELRTKQLDLLASRREAAWREIEQVFDLPLSSHAKGTAYDAKARLLRDLRALAEREGGVAAFEVRVADLRRRQEKRSAFWRRYDA